MTDSNDQVLPLEQLQSAAGALVCDAVTGICAPVDQADAAPPAGLFTLPGPAASESDEEAG